MAGPADICLFFALVAVAVSHGGVLFLCGQMLGGRRWLRSRAYRRVSLLELSGGDLELPSSYREL